jgi:hypothetical protein
MTPHVEIFGVFGETELDQGRLEKSGESRATSRHTPTNRHRRHIRKSPTGRQAERSVSKIYPKYLHFEGVQFP